MIITFLRNKLVKKMLLKNDGKMCRDVILGQKRPESLLLLEKDEWIEDKVE